MSSKRSKAVPDKGSVGNPKVKPSIVTPKLEKALADEGKRIVNMTDVTVTREKLTKAAVVSKKIPGNEVPKFVDGILKAII